MFSSRCRSVIYLYWNFGKVKLSTIHPEQTPFLPLFFPIVWGKQRTESKNKHVQRNLHPQRNCVQGHTGMDGGRLYWVHLPGKCHHTFENRRFKQFSGWKLSPCFLYRRCNEVIMVFTLAVVPPFIITVLPSESCQHFQQRRLCSPPATSSEGRSSCLISWVSVGVG